MTRLILTIALAAVTLALPAAAHADGITATCTAGGVTAACDGRWYTSDVTVSFILPAGASNPQGCGDQTISSDTAGVTITCTVAVSGTQCCRLDVPIKRDATPPTASAITAQRAPDVNGWYNHGVGVAVTGSDATSGIASCTSVTYSGPDSASASVNGTCTDEAGNTSAAKTLTFQYDATPPGVSAAPARPADANGWYNHPVDVAFQGTDAVSGIESCSSGSYAGPDSASATVSGSCRDKAGNVAGSSFPVQYDSTPPTVTAPAPSRPPDANGWYNHALTVAFNGSDALSGIGTCDTVSYAKPDDGSASVSGGCRDKAGNASAPTKFAFKFDSTPPKLGKLDVAPANGAVSLTWSASADVAAVTITRTHSGKGVTVYHGKRITRFTDKKVENGRRYSYVVTAFDAAGNQVLGKAAGDPSAPLLSPRSSAELRGTATLRWRPAPHATYYNVQLWRRGKKILTTWPARPSLHLPRLQPGVYTWLVWPGLGSRSAHRYGTLIGRSSFTIRG